MSNTNVNNPTGAESGGEVEDYVLSTSCVGNYVFDDKTLYLDDGSGHFILEDITYEPASAAGGAGSGQIKASMDGAIVEVLVTEGDVVEAGQTLVVLEAMKMEHPLKAGVDGTVTAISCEAGQQVKSKQLLATVEGNDND